MKSYHFYCEQEEGCDASEVVVYIKYDNDQPLTWKPPCPVCDVTMELKLKDGIIVES
ncbi:hypothetical protein LCGC14_0267780 [marine sediment metagenome]|uniref:Uncharacterized protein n=1 Tax=marine sediment metagenome TaxID=412755 RepID=A0A0F9UGV8_9ZZZZ